MLFSANSAEWLLGQDYCEGRVVGSVEDAGLNVLVEGLELQCRNTLCNNTRPFYSHDNFYCNNARSDRKAFGVKILELPP